MSTPPLPIPMPPGYQPSEAAEAAPSQHIPPEGRDELGRIKPGFGGRPAGVKNKRARITLEGVQDLAPDALRMLGTLVRQGHLAAIKLVLDATLPRGGRTIDLDGTADPHKLIEAVTTGEISPDEFARLAQGWKTAADAAELKEIKAQIDEMEALVSAMRK
jgi:hypothetical protein